MKHFLLLALCLFISKSYSQLVITENADSRNGDRFNFTIKNVGVNTAIFYWEIETIPAMPTAWNATTVYDALLCHADGTKNIDCTDPIFANYILPGDSITYYQISLDIREDFDDACLIFRLLSSCENQISDTLGEINFKFDSDLISSTEEIEKTNAAPYPNPFTHTLALTNDNRVAQIRVIDNKGMTISKMIHRPDMTHNLPDLSEGSYILQLFDMSDNFLQSIKVVKQE